MYEDAEKGVKRSLCEADQVASQLTDGQGAQQITVRPVTITAHFIYNDWTMQTVVLQKKLATCELWMKSILSQFVQSKV